MSAFFFNRKPKARTYPQPDVTDVSVSVTPAERQRAVIDNDPAPLDFNPDPFVAAEIRLHLWLQRNAREVTP